MVREEDSRSCSGHILHTRAESQQIEVARPLCHKHTIIAWCSHMWYTWLAMHQQAVISPQSIPVHTP